DSQLFACLPQCATLSFCRGCGSNPNQWFLKRLRMCYQILINGSATFRNKGQMQQDSKKQSCDIPLLKYAAVLFGSGTGRRRDRSDPREVEVCFHNIVFLPDNCLRPKQKKLLPP